MGSNIIVIATLIFLLFSAAVLVLMLYSIQRNPPEMSTVSSHAEILPRDSRHPAYDPMKNTRALDDIQDFIKAKAEILYNGNAYPLNTDYYKIGRSRDCNLVVSDDFATREHCVINYHDNIFTLSDFHTTNGTYVNGERITSVELHDGDEIMIGFAVLTFKRRNERKADESGAENPSQQTD